MSVFGVRFVDFVDSRKPRGTFFEQLVNTCAKISQKTLFLRVSMPVAFVPRIFDGLTRAVLPLTAALPAVLEWHPQH
jgi:hypothetical protein